MKALLVDDDLYFCEMFLQSLYENCKVLGIQIECDICYDSGQALQYSNRYDIYFLDIEMPEMNGLDVAEELRLSLFNKEIIFLSFHEKYMWKTFDVKPTAFIRKHQLDNDLREALILVIKHNQRNYETVEISFNHKNTGKIKPMEILYCKSEEHYVRFVQKDGKSMLHRTKLEQVEKILTGYHFVRVHSRYLVNLEYVHIMTADKTRMLNGQEIPISRVYKKKVQMIAFNWKEQKEGANFDMDTEISNLELDSFSFIHLLVMLKDFTRLIYRYFKRWNYGISYHSIQK